MQYIRKQFYSIGIHAIERLKNGLYIIGTPIGNMDDITLRSIRVLRSSDIILCENIQHTKVLLNTHNILSYSNIKLKTYHDPYKGLPKSFKQILDNARYSVVSLVSDAGTPCISDPGHVLIKECYKENIPVFGIPGPSAVTLALSISGFNCNKYIFEGFLPIKVKEKEQVLEQLKEQNKTIVFYESPERIIESLELCKKILGGKRKVAVMRELTKLYENVIISSLDDIIPKIKVKGEFTVILE